MHLKTSTSVTFPVYRTFYLFNFLQGKRSPWQARITLALPPLLFFLMLILLALDPAEPFNLMGLAVSLALMVLLALILTIMPKKYYRSVFLYLDGPTNFVFAEDHFEVDSTSTKWQGHTDSPYETLFKVYETRGYFYLYITRSQAHIVSKANLTADSAIDLRRLFAARLGARFVVTRPAQKEADSSSRGV